MGILRLFSEPHEFGFFVELHLNNIASFIVAGGAGFVGMVAYAAKNFKNRKSTASMYVMHYRVVAQFMFIGAMGGGVAVGLLYAAFMGDPRKRNVEQQESKDNMASK